MNGGNGGGVDLYLLAGVQTWPTYFREPAERLKVMSIEAGYADANVHVLYPYGDHTIPLHRQLREVARDVMRRLALAADRLQLADIGATDAPNENAGRFPSGAETRTGDRTGATRPNGGPQPDDAPLPFGVSRPGAAGSPVPPDGAFAGLPPTAAASGRLASAPPAGTIVEEIRERSAGRIVVLIGHSGGGVAACHAGRRLLAEGAVRDCRIAQIGSPKVRIHPALRDRTAYFYAADERGRIRDPITRLGTWGGIRRGAAGIPVWDPRRWAPGHIAAIPIDGGHKDYFILGPSGAPGRTSNFERTAAAVLDWLVRSLRTATEPARQPQPAASSPAEPEPPSPAPASSPAQRPSPAQ